MGRTCVIESFMTMTVLLSPLLLLLVLVTPLTQAAEETFNFDDVSAAGCTCNFEIKVDSSNGRIMGTTGSCDPGCTTTIKKLKLEGDGCTFDIAGLKVKKGKLPKKWRFVMEIQVGLSSKSLNMVKVYGGHY